MVFRCFVCNLICLVFFLLEIYKIVLFVVVNCCDICKSNVDLFILGLLLIKINEFGIMLLFKIWFSFINLVFIWGFFLGMILDSCCGCVFLLVKFILVWWLEVFWIIFFIIEFYCL